MIHLDLNLQDPAFSRTALYWLDGGHYLFRHREDSRTITKFVTAADVAAAFSGQLEDSGWVASGIVRFGQSAKGPWYVFFAPPARATIYLEDKGELGGVPLPVPLPGLVLLGFGRLHYVWAVRTSTFNPDNPAYYAPFPNIYDDNHVCWGVNAPPEVRREQAARTWKLFLDSPFTASLLAGKSNAYPTDVRKQLQALAMAKAETYPVDDLRPIGGLSIAQAIGQVIKPGVEIEEGPDHD